MVTPVRAGAQRLIYRYRGVAQLFLVTVFLLAGCAHPLRQVHALAPEGAQWSGRLALSILSEPAQSLAAGFELRGTPRSGEMQLFTPLGNTLAVLTWTPTTATLRHEAQAQTSGSLDALVMQAMGIELPVTALFDWLNNIPTEVAGWHADLSQLPQGRLQVRRSQPAPAVELRLKLEQ